MVARDLLLSSDVRGIVQHSAQRRSRPAVMIAEIMIFALGFLVAGILALLVLPLFWRRAVRLSRRRVEMQMPLSIAEVVADRDRLRAEFAVERRRLEQSLDGSSVKRAEAMGREGRSETAALALGKKLALSDAALGAAEAGVRDLEAQFGALCIELHDAQSLLVSRSEALATLQSNHRSVSELADERRAVSAALETRLSGLEMRFADSLHDLASARSAQAEAVERARLFEGQRDTARERHTTIARLHSDLEGSASDHGRRIKELSASLKRSREELRTVSAENEDLRREADHADERAKSLRTSLERQSDARRAQERDVAVRIEATQSHVAELKSALEEARRDNAELRREVAAPAHGRRRSGGRDARSLKGLQVVASDRSDELPDEARAADTVFDRPV